MAAWASARAIARLDLGGSTGIDCPGLRGKADRIAVDAILDDYLPKPFERTAMNGFGFVQVVRPKARPSLIDLAQDRPAFEARELLRRAGRHVGAATLSAHPAVIAAIRPDWVDALARQIGGAVTLHAEPSLAMAAGHVH
jgi:ribonuclease G